MYDSKKSHQKDNSSISAHVLPDQVPAGSKVLHPGSSTQALGDTLGVELGFNDGNDEGMDDGNSLGI